MKNKPLIAQKSLPPRGSQLESRCNLSDDGSVDEITVLGRITVNCFHLGHRTKIVVWEDFFWGPDRQC